MKEIERKFLVDEKKLPKDLVWESVKQGYLSFEPQVRIRIWRGTADITVKSHGTVVRDEFKYDISLEDAEEMMKICDSRVILKDRALPIIDGKEWTVDRFYGANEGLVTAEIELTSESESVSIPEWITKEVSGDERYLNINLARNPISI